jgi:hypothetical protein
MKRKHQVRNFFRHVKKAGLFLAVLTLVLDFFVGADIYYTDDGVMVSAETMWL